MARVPLRAQNGPFPIGLRAAFPNSMLLMQDVQKSFVEPNGNPLQVLDIGRLELAAGEQIAVRGRSGCGKTTLLHAIAGITRIDHGSIEVDGCELTRLGEAARDRFRAERIGYVFQTFNLLDAFSALENVLLGMWFSGGRNDSPRAMDLLSRVGLADRAAHRPGQLSVGEQQRVAVARSLANRPRLMLADEPTANVDPANQQQIVDLIRETCRDENVALMMVTHAPEVAEQFDRVEHLQEINRVAGN